MCELTDASNFGSWSSSGSVEEVSACSKLLERGLDKVQLLLIAVLSGMVLLFGFTVLVLVLFSCTLLVIVLYSVLQLELLVSLACTLAGIFDLASVGASFSEFVGLKYLLILLF